MNVTNNNSALSAGEDNTLATDYDVAIIGGGINGAGVAQACAAAGYTTVLIEKSDWAAGTSSKSSKLIHGGLRYLETLQLPLVWQSLSERQILLDIAGDLVKPLEFVVPIYRHTKRRPWELRIGLSLYSLLAGLSPLSRYKSIAIDPLLKHNHWQNSFSYWDAQTDDRLLTQAVVKSACSLGADTLNNTRLERATQTAEGYQLDIRQHDNPTQIQCQFLINCSGPWINQIMDLITPTPTQQSVELVKGSHLILKGQLSDKAFYLESPLDQRAVFLLPWKGNTLLGTTEEIFTGDPDKVTASQREIDYLLATAKEYFPNMPTEIIDQFAGLRVLPSGDSMAFSRPRECILHQDKTHPALLSLYGGKLTTYRHMAQLALKPVIRRLGERVAIADTKNIKLG